jgi:hypothetical protein
MLSRIEMTYQSGNTGKFSLDGLWQKAPVSVVLISFLRQA